MQRWKGHRSTTSVVLLDLLTTAHTGKTAFSRKQRALFTACEFWAACRNGVLLQHLGDRPQLVLQSAELSFELIGLPATAALLRSARIEVEESRPPPAIENLAEVLERDMEGGAEDIDAALAAYADPSGEGAPGGNAGIGSHARNTGRH